VCGIGAMRQDNLENRRWISLAILASSLPVYAYLCWPAISRRGFPEIDPLWLGMRWLWIVPIVLSSLFDGSTQWRKWAVRVYTFLAAFFFGGTFIGYVPHQVNLEAMVLATVFLWGPLNLLTAFVVEKASQHIIQPLLISTNATPRQAIMTRVVRRGALTIGILGIAAAFPFADRAAVFYAARSSAAADAERD
jgi:hypothetical protein